MDLRITLACTLAAALAGCHTGPSPTAPQRPAGAATGPAVPLTLRGTATYLERIAVPPGASLRVELLDAGSGARIAETTMRDVAGPPFPFSIDAPAGRTASRHAVRATLLGPQGEAWFETPAPVVAMPGAPVEIRLRRVTAGATPASGGTAAVAQWKCGELVVASRFEADGTRVQLSFAGRSVTLPIARSASGARYADAGGNEFWTKGATGSLSLAGEPRRDCTQVAQPVS
ncbi:MAG TPA: MliC family protein [Lysobacter sp.]